jgi:hypothetical protein
MARFFFDLERATQEAWYNRSGGIEVTLCVSLDL